LDKALPQIKGRISVTYNWLKKIPGSLLERDEIPLFGGVPTFPLEKFTEELANALQNNSIRLEVSEPQWRSESDLFAGVGTPYKILTMVISNLEGKLYWVMAEQEISRLMATLLVPGNPDSDYIEGFNHFLGLEAINAFRRSGFDSRLSIQLLRESQQPSGDLLTMDAIFSINKSSFSGRLLIDVELRRSMKTFYAKEAQSDVFKSPLAEKLNAYVGVEVGKVALTVSEWAEVASGDFIILDTCSLKPGDTKGRVTITYQGKPFFLAKFQEGSIKLSERPLYNEVNMSTDEHDDDEFEDEEELEEDEEYEDEDDEEEEDDEEHDEEELDDHEESDQEDSQADVSVVPEEKKKIAKGPDEIPLNVVVEIARLQMPLKTLMNLQPGNLLDLDIHPENGVDLVVNGNRIAKGELLQIGEKLGVRILEK
jgi:flagellar motor switch protein FliN/FliY